jgi:REP element-mobilizing transposase RayT
MIDYRCPLEIGKFYHIYNRGNAGTNLFYNRGNYEFFLLRYSEYLTPYVDTYALCLLPNHFHLLVQVKDVPHSLDVPHFKNVSHQGNGKPIIDDHPASTAFKRLFTSYSKAINKQRNRHGSLFEKPFRRKLVTDTRYLANLVFYIHANPQLHGIINDFRQYPWSSYERILKNSPTRLQKDAVLQWFSSKENYVSYHERTMDIDSIKELMIDD